MAQEGSAIPECDHRHPIEVATVDSAEGCVLRVCQKERR